MPAVSALFFGPGPVGRPNTCGVAAVEVMTEREEAGMLEVITGEKESRAAARAFEDAMRRGTKTRRCSLGYQGGGGDYDVYWNPRHRVWSVFERASNRYWFCFGLHEGDGPAEGESLGIGCEINPPLSGIDRRCAGAFANDEAGRLVLTHSGKVGGGRPGIGKRAFLDSLRGVELVEARWPDGQVHGVIPIGDVGSDRLQAHVALFVRQVAEFKAAATGSGVPSPTLQPGFRPEFSGDRSAYKIAGEVETRCDHGLVVNALAEGLQAMECEVRSDRSRDLFLMGPRGEVAALIEVKVPTDPQAVYEGLGQLLFHGGLPGDGPRKILVLPDSIDPAIAAKVRSLGVELVTYGWSGGTPAFPDLACFAVDSSRP